MKIGSIFNRFILRSDENYSVEDQTRRRKVNENEIYFCGTVC